LPFDRKGRKRRLFSRERKEKGNLPYRKGKTSSGEGWVISRKKKGGGKESPFGREVGGMEKYPQFTGEKKRGFVHIVVGRGVLKKKREREAFFPKRPHPLKGKGK